MGLLGNYLNKKTGGKMGTPSSGGGGDTFKSGSDDASVKELNETVEKGFYGSPLTSYHKGGIVKKTGPAIVKKGERVLTKAQQKKRVSGKKI